MKFFAKIVQDERKTKISSKFFEYAAYFQFVTLVYAMTILGLLILSFV